MRFDLVLGKKSPLYQQAFLFLDFSL